jgi:hypothetical protein
VNNGSFVEFFGTHGPRANIFEAEKFNALFTEKVIAHPALTFLPLP